VCFGARQDGSLLRCHQKIESAREISRIYFNFIILHMEIIFLFDSSTSRCYELPQQRLRIMSHRRLIHSNASACGSSPPRAGSREYDALGEIGLVSSDGSALKYTLSSSLGYGRELSTRTTTRSFGTGRREAHDSSAFYNRKICALPKVGAATCSINRIPPDQLNRIYGHSSARMSELLENSVALMVTSPPYNVGKDYDEDLTLAEYLEFLGKVLQETHRVLVPGGRVAFNVANLGRKPYIPLNAYIAGLAAEIGFLMRGEIIWVKGKASSGSCAWGSWLSAVNPTLRDMHEYVLIFCKERFDRPEKGCSTIAREDFLSATISVWTIPPESARRVGHPAPFPVALVERLIQLYTFQGDVVLDPFMGSGSTAVAAVRCGRSYIGYEINPAYVATCEQRIAEARESSAERQAPFFSQVR